MTAEEDESDRSQARPDRSATGDGFPTFEEWDKERV